MQHRPTTVLMTAAALLSVGVIVQAGQQVSYDRLTQAAQDPDNWLMHSGQYHSQRYSQLDAINRDTVSRLRLTWVHQLPTLGQVQTTPLVVDGVMYATTPDNEVYALDATTGKAFWSYQHDTADTLTLCCSKQNRGVAMLGDRLYLATLDARLIALGAATGHEV